eukprot:TRINITY_DN8994_c0_g1_i1.p1 TRINITY_DN8994_c0_g1~~TRINITY_DN8994_c0_g1_i1.p1  ORF type:complete len:1495 (+),score=483.96 TRINITY_DN8994_c0_g1_i1:137-4486(+)
MSVREDAQGWLGAVSSLVGTAVAVPVQYAAGKATGLYASAPSVDELKDAYNSFDYRKTATRVTATLPEVRQRARLLAEDSAERLDRYMQARVSPDFVRFCKQLSACASGEEEAAAVREEALRLERELAQGQPGGRWRELLIRALLCQMLGHPTVFAESYAVQLCGAGRTVAERRLGYLATQLLVPPTSEMHIMVSNLLSRDVQSSSWIVAANALAALRQLATLQTLPLFEAPVIASLEHPEPEVRTRGVLCLQAFYLLLRRLPEESEGRRRVVESARNKLFDMIHDTHPQVTNAALHFVLEVAADDPDTVAALFVKQIRRLHRVIVDRRLGDAYRYQGHVAPWAQITILRIYASLAGVSSLWAEPPAELSAMDRPADEGGADSDYSVTYHGHAPETEVPALIDASLKQFLKANTQTVLEGALLYEVVRTVSRLLPTGGLGAASAQLGQLARDCTLKLLRHIGPSHRYMGLRALRELLPAVSQLQQPERQALGAALASRDQTSATVARRCLCSALRYSHEAPELLGRIERDLAGLVDPDEGHHAARWVLASLPAASGVLGHGRVAAFCCALVTRYALFLPAPPGDDPLGRQPGGDGRAGEGLTATVCAAASADLKGAPSQRDRERGAAVWVRAVLPLLRAAAEHPPAAFRLAAHVAAECFPLCSPAARAELLSALEGAVGATCTRLPSHHPDRIEGERAAAGALRQIVHGHLSCITDRSVGARRPAAPGRGSASGSDGSEALSGSDSETDSESELPFEAAAEACLASLAQCLDHLSASADVTAQCTGIELGACIAASAGGSAAVEVLTSAPDSDMRQALRRADCFSFLGADEEDAPVRGDGGRFRVDRGLGFLNSFVREALQGSEHKRVYVARDKRGERAGPSGALRFNDYSDSQSRRLVVGSKDPVTAALGPEEAPQKGPRLRGDVTRTWGPEGYKRADEAKKPEGADDVLGPQKVGDSPAPGGPLGCAQEPVAWGPSGFTRRAAGEDEDQGQQPRARPLSVPYVHPEGGDRAGGGEALEDEDDCAAFQGLAPASDFAMGVGHKKLGATANMSVACWYSYTPSAVLVHVAISNRDPPPAEGQGGAAGGGEPHDDAREAGQAPRAHPLRDVVVVIDTGATALPLQAVGDLVRHARYVQRATRHSLRLAEIRDEAVVTFQLDPPEELCSRPAALWTLGGSVKSSHEAPAASEGGQPAGEQYQVVPQGVEESLVTFRVSLSLCDFVRPSLLNLTAFQTQWLQLPCLERALLLLPSGLRLEDALPNAAASARSTDGSVCVLACQTLRSQQVALLHLRTVKVPPELEIEGMRDVELRVRSSCRKVAMALAHLLAPFINRRVRPGCLQGETEADEGRLPGAFTDHYAPVSVDAHCPPALPESKPQLSAARPSESADPDGGAAGGSDSYCSSSEVSDTSTEASLDAGGCGQAGGKGCPAEAEHRGGGGAELVTSRN